jgi:hypothetical protein
MKFLFVLAFAGFSVCFFCSSCTKTQTNTVTVTDTVVKTVTDTLKPPTTIVGFWVGTYQVTGSPLTYYVSFDLRPDSSVLYKGVGADGNTYYGQGTYSLTGSSLTYTFTTLNLSQTGAVQNGTGTYSASNNSISGNWLNQGTIEGGTFSVAKSQ